MRTSDSLQIIAYSRRCDFQSDQTASNQRAYRAQTRTSSSLNLRQSFILAATIEQPGFLQPSLDFTYLYAQDPGVSPSTASDLTLAGDQIPRLPEKRSSSSGSSPRPVKKLKQGQRVEQSRKSTSSEQKGAGMAGSDAGGNTTVADGVQPVNKPKRVRTGCLTCRERHLKCDEALPNCQNCRKSNRVCKRGIRLNFIDTQVQAPPVVPPTQEWTVSFLDESREIANEYKGGLSKYGVLEIEPTAQTDNSLSFDFSTSVPPPTSVAHQPLPPIQGILPDPYPEEQHNLIYESHREPPHQHAHPHTESTYSGSNMQGGSSSYGNPEQNTPAEGARDYLDTQEEVLFMQVFVEEVGLWMDSMDPMKHVSPASLWYHCDDAQIPHEQRSNSSSRFGDLCFDKIRFHYHLFSAYIVDMCLVLATASVSCSK